jgi:hypothetical protein
VAFNAEAIAELMRLDLGDAISVQGALTIDEYGKDGEKRMPTSSLPIMSLLCASRKRATEDRGRACARAFWSSSGRVSAKIGEMDRSQRSECLSKRFLLRRTAGP